MKRLVKVIRDENGDIIDYKIKQLTSSNTKPRGGEYLLLDDFETNKHPKIEIVNGEVIIVEDSTKKDFEESVELRLKRMDFGRRIIAIISIRNDAKNLTQAQTVQFVKDYSDINTALLNGSIGTAKALIDAVVPDGTITTIDDKNAMLDEITANESDLGY